VKFLAADDMKGVYITNRVMKYPSLSLAEKVLWAKIAEYQEYKDYPFNPQEVGDEICMTAKEVSKIVKSLVKKEFAYYAPNNRVHLNRHPLFDEDRPPLSVTITEN